MRALAVEVPNEETRHSSRAGETLVRDYAVTPTRVRARRKLELRQELETGHPYARAGETSHHPHPAQDAPQSPLRARGRDSGAPGRISQTRAGLKRPNGDQPKPYEGYVIPVMTPWSASPAPGPVAQH